MATTFIFCEDNGAAAGDPAKGTTRTFGRTGCDWKSEDSSTDNYGSFPITAGNFSYKKFQFGLVSGSANNVLNAKFAHTTGVFDAGISLFCQIGTGYTTPDATQFSSPINITIPSGIGASYQSLTLGTVGPQAAASGTLPVSTGIYTCYFGTILSTESSAPAGNLSESIVLTVSYDEN